MFDIPIYDLHYHGNILTKEELAFASGVCKSTLKRYPALVDFTKKTLAPLSLEQNGRLALLSEITLAFCHVMKTSFPPETREQLEKTVKKWLYSFLPCITENLLIFRAPYPVQYEPITAVSLHASHHLMKHCMPRLDAETENDFDLYYHWELTALLRALRSSLLLLSSGDDVHGCSLLRGVLEIFSKLKLAPHFQEEYVLFKVFNVYLQANKQKKEPLPPEMLNYVGELAEYKRNPESFLAYGWARDKSGKRILSMKKLLSEADYAQPLEGLTQVASEFVHEDYIGIGYDYPQIRKGLIDYYFALLYLLYHDHEFSILIPKSVAKKERHLLSAAAAVYKGDPALSDFAML